MIDHEPDPSLSADDGRRLVKGVLFAFPFGIAAWALVIYLTLRIAA